MLRERSAKALRRAAGRARGAKMGKDLRLKRIRRLGHGIGPKVGTNQLAQRFAVRRILGKSKDEDITQADDIKVRKNDARARAESR